MPTFFVSYKRDEIDQVREFVDALKQKQKYCCMVWIDQDKLIPGSDWRRSIEKAIDYADAVLLMLSPSAVQSVHVRAEIAYALEKDKNIIPIMLQPVPTEDLESLGLNDRQAERWFEVRPGDQLRSLKRIAKGLPKDKTEHRLTLLERERFVNFVVHWRDKCRLTNSEIVAQIKEFHCEELSVVNFENIFLRADRTPKIPMTLLIALAKLFKDISKNFSDTGDQFTRIEALELVLLAGSDEQYWIDKIRKTFPPKWLWKIATNNAPCYERETLISNLYEQIKDEKSSISTYLMMGLPGIGKTTIAHKLAQKALEESDFDYVGGFSLQNLIDAPSFIDELLRFVSNYQKYSPSDDINQKITLLLTNLREQRCLIILDNFETALLSMEGDNAKYREYRLLMDHILKGAHKSIFIVTSNRMPEQLQNTSKVEIITPKGLSSEGVSCILKDQGIVTSPETCARLAEKTAGNPLQAIIYAKNYNSGHPQSEPGDFSVPDNLRISPLQELIERIVETLTPLQQDIVYWLMIVREPITINEITDNLIGRHSLPSIIQTNLNTLCERGLIEINDDKQYFLRNGILDCLNDLFVKNVYLELDNESPKLLMSHALVQATAKNYIRDIQFDYILLPLLASFRKALSPKNLDDKLTRIFNDLPSDERSNPNYLAGNIINLLNALGRLLHNRDFSRASVRQAYLRDVELHNVNFEESDIQDCTFSEMFGSVLAVSISSDGRYLAACTTKAETRLWDIAELRHVKSFWGNPTWIHHTIFTPDVRRIITAEGGGYIKIWNIETEMCEVDYKAHEQRIYRLAISPDGTLLASCGDDATVKFWDTTRGYKKVFVFQSEVKEEWIRGIAFSPDGRYFAAASEKCLRIWELSTYECIRQIEAVSLWTVAFSPDGNLLAFSGETCVVKVLDTKDWTLMWESNEENSHQNTIWTLVFSSDGQSIATSSADKSIKLWDAISGTCKQTVYGQNKTSQNSEKDQSSNSRHRRWVRGLAYTPNGELLISGSDEGLICIRDASTGRTLNTLMGRTDGIRYFALSLDGKRLAASSEQERIELWDLTDDTCSLWKGYTGWVRSIAFSPDGRTVATTDVDKIYLCDVHTGDRLQVFYHEPEAWVWSVAFSPDGQWLAATGEAVDQKDIFIWNLFTGEQERISNAFDRWRWRVAFSPDGRYIVGTDDIGAVRFWDFQTRELKFELKHEQQIWGVAFSADMTRFATTGHDKEVHLWELTSSAAPRLICVMPQNATAESIAFTPDSRLLVSGTFDGLLRIWDAKQGKPVCAPIRAHNAQINSVACTVDNRYAITASADGYIRFWSLKDYSLSKELKAKQFYEGMNISCVAGISEAQVKSLLKLGAVQPREC
jgi:WD40 repeat protein